MSSVREKASGLESAVKDVGSLSSKPFTQLDIAWSKRCKATIKVRKAAIIGEAAQGCVERVNELLSSTPNAIEYTFNGVNAIHVASRNGHIKMVELLLGAGADKDCVDDVGKSVLHHATEGNQAAIVDLLLNSGADVNAVNFDQQTALHIAVSKSWLDCVEVLLKHGCDVNMKEQHGYTALHYALKYAEDWDNQRGCLPSFANDRITEMLVTAPDVNLSVKNKCGDNYLCHAAMYGHDFGIQLLVGKAKELVHQTNGRGSTALHTAVLRGHHDTCGTLITVAPFLLNRLDADGYTPLHWAVSRCSCSLIELMVSTGVSCLFVNNDDENILHFAFGHIGTTRDEDAYDFLLENSTAIKPIFAQLDAIGERSLFLAIGCYLIRDAHADVNGKNIFDITPLDILAKTRRNSDKVKKFLSQMVEAREEKARQNDANVMLSERIKDLELKVTSLENDRLCPYCMYNGKNIMFQCGHGACDLCADSLIACRICSDKIMKQIKYRSLVN